MVCIAFTLYLLHCCIVYLLYCVLKSCYMLHCGPRRKIVSSHEVCVHRCCWFKSNHEPLKKNCIGESGAVIALKTLLLLCFLLTYVIEDLYCVWLKGITLERFCYTEQNWWNTLLGTVCCILEKFSLGISLWNGYSPCSALYWVRPLSYNTGLNEQQSDSKQTNAYFPKVRILTSTSSKC